MNDDFEKKLQHQSLRRVPVEWREEILAAATHPERKSAPEESIPLWRLIFARFPIASSAFAGFWIVLIAINIFLFGSFSGSPTNKSVARNDEPASIWRLQNAEIQQLASGDESIASEHPAPAPRAVPQSPRSDLRRDDEGVGELFFEHASNFVA